MNKADEIEYMVASREITAAAHQIELDALKAELNKAYKNLSFYRCCALSGETPKEGSEPYPRLEGKGDE